MHRVSTDPETQKTFFVPVPTPEPGQKHLFRTTLTQEKSLFQSFRLSDDQINRES